MVWWAWKLFQSYAMAVSVTRSQPNWTPVGAWNSVFINKTLTCEIIHGRMVSLPSNSVPDTCRIYAKVHWSCSGLWWPNTLLRHFMLIFNTKEMWQLPIVGLLAVIITTSLMCPLLPSALLSPLLVADVLHAHQVWLAWVGSFYWSDYTVLSDAFGL